MSKITDEVDKIVRDGNEYAVICDLLRETERLRVEVRKAKGLYGLGGAGLTPRELFAAMAMQGLLARTDPSLAGPHPMPLRTTDAALAVHCADALIAALAETKP